MTAIAHERSGDTIGGSLQRFASSLSATEAQANSQQPHVAQQLQQATGTDLAPELSEALAASKQRLNELKRDRASHVAELTRLSEALADARARQAMAETEAEQLGKEHESHATRRAEVQRRLEESAARVQVLRERCVAAQATTPQPMDIERVSPEVQPLLERAAVLDASLKNFDEELQQRKERKERLEQACKAEAKAVDVAQRNVAVLEEVYERADRVLQDLEQVAETKGDVVDPELTVLALARAAMPLVRFSDAADAVAHMRRMAKVLRPQLMPNRSPYAAAVEATTPSSMKAPPLPPRAVPRGGDILPPGSGVARPPSLGLAPSGPCGRSASVARTRGATPPRL